MNQNRKDDTATPNRQSNMEKAEGSREDEQGAGRDDSMSSGQRHNPSVMDDKEHFEHGSGPDTVAGGMSSAGERGSGANREQKQGGGITNRGTDRERSEQRQLPERGRSKSGR